MERLWRLLPLQILLALLEPTEDLLTQYECHDGRLPLALWVLAIQAASNLKGLGFYQISVESHSTFQDATNMPQSILSLFRNPRVEMVLQVHFI
jgi:hypothetical protein